MKNSPLWYAEPTKAKSIIPVVLSLPACNVPKTLSLTFSLPDLVRYFGGFSSITRNFSNSLIHCGNNSVFWSRIKVLTFLFAIIYAARTVFPNAVAAHKTPFSYFSNLAAAYSCCSLSVPLKLTLIGLPNCLLSVISHFIPDSLHLASNLSYIPLGILI